ncbi:MAG: RNB domain-containing ribonuclease [Spirochaetaceae bacterium]|nr:RNB domain-containing ribonuclease [Spirochaetaceae bacterium]
MSEESYRPGNLVVYKSSPARVVSVGTKIEIVLPDGKNLGVRAKDIVFLHAQSPDSLAVPEELPEDLDAAREIFQGTTTTLAAFAEVLYGAFTPAAALGVYRLLADGLHCRGTPGELYVPAREEYEAEAAQRAAKKRGAQDRADLLERIRQGKLEEGDSKRLREIEDFALEKSAGSRILKELGVSGTPQAAHALLLKLGVWDATVNPYLTRLGLRDEDLAPPPELPPGREEERLDLCHLAAFAIDDEGTGDPDDAVSFDNGKIWIHVADPASRVSPGTPADTRAADRGVTLYLPDRKVPLLAPEAVALFGLGLCETSLALSFCIDVGDDGSLRAADIKLTKVRVRRMSYGEAQEALDTDRPEEGSDAAELKKIYGLTSRYEARRMRADAISIELPEVKIRAEGGKVSIQPLAKTASAAMVREAMLMAGEAAARFAGENNIPVPYATQEAPAEPCENPQTPAEMYECRKKLRPSATGIIPAPHAGLGLELYCRATSPLRRYADLLLHQQIRAFLSGGPVLSADEISDRVFRAGEAAGRAQKIERISNLHWTCAYLLQNPGWQGAAVVVEKAGRHCTVIFPALGLETKVTLPRDIPLNEEVVMKAARVDLARLETDFTVV